MFGLGSAINMAKLVDNWHNQARNKKGYDYPGEDAVVVFCARRVGKKTYQIMAVERADLFNGGKDIPVAVAEFDK